MSYCSKLGARPLSGYTFFFLILVVFTCMTHWYYTCLTKTKRGKGGGGGGFLNNHRLFSKGPISWINPPSSELINSLQRVWIFTLCYTHTLQLRRGGINIRFNDQFDPKIFHFFHFNIFFLWNRSFWHTPSNCGGMGLSFLIFLLIFFISY